MEIDDGIRSKKGLALCIRDMGNGKSRLFIDDIVTEDLENPIDWSFESFYTFTPELGNASMEQMNLTKEEFANIGIAVIARLLAHNGRLK